MLLGYFTGDVGFGTTDMIDSLPPSRPPGLLSDVNGDGRADFQDFFDLPADTPSEDVGQISPGRSILRPTPTVIDPAAIVRTILDENPGMRILAFGERHEQPPLAVLTEAIRQLRERGKKVVFAFEMVTRPAGSAPDGSWKHPFNPKRRASIEDLLTLIRQFNDGEISGQEFLPRLRQEFERNHLLIRLYPPHARDDLLSTIEVAISAGADQFHAIDSHEGYVHRSDFDPGPYGLKPNRDRTMATRVEYLARRNGPESVVVGVFGIGHISEKPIQNDTRSPPMFDPGEPMGRRLAAIFGDAFVSVRSFGIIDHIGRPSQAGVERKAAELMILDKRFIADPDAGFDYTTL